MAINKGMVLIVVLVFLLVMALLVSAMLLVSQLSHKTAYAAQQQLQTSQLALKQHLSQLTSLPAGELPAAELMADCPASYAAWSGGAVQCELLRVDTETYSGGRHFYAGYSSLLLRQSLAQKVD